VLDARNFELKDLYFNAFFSSLLFYDVSLSKMYRIYLFCLYIFKKYFHLYTV